MKARGISETESVESRGQLRVWAFKSIVKRKAGAKDRGTGKGAEMYGIFVLLMCTTHIIFHRDHRLNEM